MERYINEETIVKNEIYDAFKDDIICPKCSKIIIEPQMCMKCQNVYCKKCLVNYSNLKKCPKDGKESVFIKSISKKDLLSKLKYKCKNCSKIVFQTDINAHLEKNCDNDEREEDEKTLSEIIKTKKQLIKLSQKEIKNKKIKILLFSLKF